MTVNEFLSKVLEIASERPTYHLGDDGSNGQCDCVGLIIGAIRRSGIKYTEVHGSNWFARHHTKGLMRITEVDDLSHGDLVYKARMPGASGYDLPNRYAKDPDRYDYYHVGVVTGLDPLEIMHCTTGGAHGIKEDTRLGNWTHKGKADMIDYTSEEDMRMETTATVTAANGKPVNLRKLPSTTSSLMDRVPVGQQVDVVESNDAWSKVVYNGMTGYMMSEFLALDTPAIGIDLLAQRVTELTKTVISLQERVKTLEEVNSVG